LAKFIVNITHRHDKTLQAIYCYACVLVELLVIMQEPHETGQRAACSWHASHVLATTGL